MTTWIPVADLGVATDATTAQLINTPATATSIAINELVLPTAEAAAADFLASDPGVEAAAIAAAGPAVDAKLAQAGGITTINLADDAVTQDKVAFVNHGKNLYDATRATIGFALNASTGAPSALAGYRLSDWVPIVAGQAYTYSHARMIGFYDAAKVWRSAAYVNNTTNATQTITPTVTGYTRFAINDVYAATFQLEAGSALTMFEPYEVVIPQMRFDLAAGAIVVKKLGELFTVSSSFGIGTGIAIETSRSGSANGAFRFNSTAIDGAQIHTGQTDDITPIRTSISTLGANHGYANVGTYTVAGHGKTTADLGSIYTDGTRQYTLLKINGNNLTFGGDYTVVGGVVNSAAVAPSVSLTHVSGGTVTTAVPVTTKVAGDQLYPSINNISVQYFLDGREILVDGEHPGQSLEVREAYTVMDYKALIDWSQANIGVAPTSNAIAGVVRLTNTYTMTARGKCLVSSTLKALTNVDLLATGFIQYTAMVRAGQTLFRYIPGVVAKSGYDFSNLVDMTSYAATILFGPGDYLDAAKPPNRVVDVLKASGVTMAGFTTGYIPDKTNSKNTDRVSLPVSFESRSTKKVYPTAVGPVSLLAGAYRTVEAYRNYTPPPTITGATNINVVQDAQDTYVFLDFHANVTAQSVAVPARMGAGITVLESRNFTLLGDVVDGEGVTFSITGGKGYAVLKLS